MKKVLVAVLAVIGTITVLWFALLAFSYREVTLSDLSGNVFYKARYRENIFTGERYDYEVINLDERSY